MTQDQMLAAIEAASDFGIREHIEGLDCQVQLVIIGSKGVTINFEKNDLRYVMEVTPVHPHDHVQHRGHYYSIKSASPDPVAA